MTAYMAGYGIGVDNLHYAIAVGIRAVSYPLRVQRIEASPSSASEYLNVYRYASATSLTGGVSITPVPMREGSDPATAAARAGTCTTSGATVSTISMSGTPSYLTNNAGVSGSYEFPFELIVKPGSGLFVVSQTTAGAVQGAGSVYGFITVFFEEVQEDWTS